jgi:isopropylmalate/homocitrate/citramalate synthase
MGFLERSSTMKKDFECHTKNWWVPEFNYMPEIVGDLNIPDKVRVYDVTLREIDQTPGSVIRGEEKVEMARELGNLGVYDIEIFPIVSREDYEALKEISSWKDRSFETSGLARTITTDIDTAAECNVDRIMLETPISMAIGSLYKCNDEDDILKRSVDGIKYCQSLGLKVSSEPWDAGKSNMAFLERFYKTIAETGVDQIIFADTYNNMMPWTVYKLVKKIREWTENKVTIVPHFHNDFGMATASTLAAVAAGSDIVHCALNSVGEKSGNAAMEELVFAMELLMGIDTGFKLDRFYPAAAKFAEITKTPININKPVLGRRTFQMGSGLLAEAFNDMEDSYDQAALLPFNPLMAGAPAVETIWGKGAGANMVQKHAAKIGVNLSKEQSQEARDRIKHESLVRKAAISEFDVNQIIYAVNAAANSSDIKHIDPGAIWR